MTVAALMVGGVSTGYAAAWATDQGTTPTEEITLAASTTYGVDTSTWPSLREKLKERAANSDRPTLRFPFLRPDRDWQKPDFQRPPWWPTPGQPAPGEDPAPEPPVEEPAPTEAPEATEPPTQQPPGNGVPTRPGGWPTDRPTSWPTTWPTSWPTAWPTAPNPAPTQPGTQPPGGPAPTGAPGSTTQYAADLITHVNAQRSANGLQPLTSNECAREAAQKWAEHLAASGEFRHQDLQAVSRSCGFPRGAGENIALVWENDPAKMVDLWMGSTGHRNNILGAGYGSIGSGVAKNSRGAWIGVHVFVVR